MGLYNYIRVDMGLYMGLYKGGYGDIYGAIYMVDIRSNLS